MITELEQICDRVKRRGGEIYPSENERLAQMYCQFLAEEGYIPEVYQEKFDKIFDLMLENEIRG